MRSEQLSALVGPWNLTPIIVPEEREQGTGCHCCLGLSHSDAGQTCHSLEV